MHRDPLLAGRHRHLHAVDVLYLGIFKELLALGLSATRAQRLAAAVIYGEGQALSGARNAVPPLTRVRACQHDAGLVRPEARRPDETRAHWLVYAPTDGYAAAIVPFANLLEHVGGHRSFGCVNLTRRLAEIEHGLLALSAARARRAMKVNAKRPRPRRPLA